MENNALITFTMILPIIELCMGIANAVSVKDKIQYPINNPANIHSCDFVPFHAVLNTSDIINLGSIIFYFRLKPKEMYFNRRFLLSAINLGEKDK